MSLPPGSVVGIVGGGQLGRMSAMAAATLGYRVHILTDEAHSPAAQVCDKVTIAAYDDLAALDRFAASVDAITFEFENVSAEGLDRLSLNTPVHPSPAVLRISQDRIAEKTFLASAGVPTTAWRAIQTEPDLAPALEALGLPAILKTTRLGYDGRGQATIRDPADAPIAFAALHPKPLILEAYVPFAAELSVIVARNAHGTAAFDPVENRHRDHILDLTFAPARLPPAITEAATEAALRVAEALDLTGLLCLELFVAADGRVLGNEIAPRPHNSGHWTLDACPHSQFALHIRAVAGLPLPPARRHSDAVMQNLVGPEGAAVWPRATVDDALIPHWYGKSEARPGRKMGHVTRLFPRDALPGLSGIAHALARLRLPAEDPGA